MNTTEPLSTWAQYRRARLEEVRAALGGRLSTGDVVATDIVMWQDDWSSEVRDAANARRRLPRPVWRAYLQAWGAHAWRDLRHAENADEIRDRAHRPNVIDFVRIGKVERADNNGHFHFVPGFVEILPNGSRVGRWCSEEEAKERARQRGKRANVIGGVPR